MLVVGLEHLMSVIDRPAFSAKMVFNRKGAIFLPVSRQHRDCKVEGISYEDDYKGNAMAAMLGPGRIEVRYHAAFKDADVGRIVGALKAMPELAFMGDWAVTYQGRPVQDGDQ